MREDRIHDRRIGFVELGKHCRSPWRDGVDHCGEHLHVLAVAMQVADAAGEGAARAADKNFERTAEHFGQASEQAVLGRVWNHAAVRVVD
ncbi:MAG: hypothetical protein ACLPV4_20155 [Solirubrobacteraceae bacterium]